MDSLDKINKILTTCILTGILFMVFMGAFYFGSLKVVYNSIEFRQAVITELNRLNQAIVQIQKQPISKEKGETDEKK